MCTLQYTYYVYGRASWISGNVRDLQGRDRRFESRAGLNLLWRCALGQGFYLHVHSLDPGVSGYPLGQGRPVCVSKTVVAAELRGS